MSFSPKTYQVEVDAAGFQVNASHTAAIAAGAATTVVKGGPGRLIGIVCTAAGTSTDNATITDDAGTGEGTLLAKILGAALTVGDQVTINLPAAVGITVTNVASGPAFTIAYS